MHFEHFYFKYPLAKSRQEKIIFIDTLIHAFHVDAKTGMLNRAAGNNLIEGSLKQAVEVLDELAGVHSLIVTPNSPIISSRCGNEGAAYSDPYSIPYYFSNCFHIANA